MVQVDVHEAKSTLSQLLRRVEAGERVLLERVRRSGLRELTFTASAADPLTDWPALVRHDPFDRLLLAQAVAADSILVTADRVLLALDGAPVLDARR